MHNSELDQDKNDDLDQIRGARPSGRTAWHVRADLHLCAFVFGPRIITCFWIGAPIRDPFWHRSSIIFAQFF